MMLVHIGGDLGTVSVVSIPRDSLVTIPAHTGPDGVAISEHQGKINSAFATGGPAVTVQTVELATGLTVDHYVEVNFAGFLSMVDAVGGVDVCLETALQDELSGLDLPAGRQTISGPQALAYVRARYIDNDFGRSERQQSSCRP
jgi:LCP family protein required for cell wall assembly